MLLPTPWLQMGSDYKPTIFKKSVQSALHGWHGKAKQKQKEKAKPGEGNILDSVTSVVWAREMNQVNPPEEQPATRREEIKQEQQEPAPEQPPPVTAESEDEAGAQKAMSERLVRLYGKKVGKSQNGTGADTANNALSQTRAS
eukprot:TRINITY_DN1741_c0_g1_i1.p2 TRINITY_DN1741_c0_g1~~TRINITY_DN1741_c0_g1_i1.p2  ORF type:complete len:143 (+),score=21.63 TRINITY_DN1741_c0_g1_i1:1394-1822(+)